MLLTYRKPYARALGNDTSIICQEPSQLIGMCLKVDFIGKLGNELRRWNNILCNSKKHEVDSAGMETHLPDNLLLALGACDKDHSQIFTAYLVFACTLPISSAQAEGCFFFLEENDFFEVCYKSFYYYHVLWGMNICRSSLSGIYSSTSKKTFSSFIV